jgi:hypothetical protein
MPRASWEDRLAKWPEALKLKQEDAKKLAPEVYRNIQSLKDSPAGGIPMTMSIFAGALDVSCEYCHVPGRWDSDEKPAKNTARRMLRLFSEMSNLFRGQSPAHDAVLHMSSGLAEAAEAGNRVRVHRTWPFHSNVELVSDCPDSQDTGFSSTGGEQYFG